MRQMIDSPGEFKSLMAPRLYCIASNVKLLPTFISKLADVYVNDGNYFLELQRIAAQQGEEAWLLAVLVIFGEHWQEQH